MILSCVNLVAQLIKFLTNGDKMQKLFSFFFSMLFLCTISYAQSNVLKVDGQLRFKSEFDNRDFNSDTKGYSYQYGRTRLGVWLSPSQNVTGYIQFQDSRTWGTEASTLADQKNLDMHQGYLKIDNFFGAPVDVQIGRQEFKIANERLMGAVDWSNVGRSFDGEIVTWRSEKFALKFFNFYEVEKYLKGDSADFSVSGVHADLKLFKNYKFEPFLIFQMYNPSDYFNRTTIGLYSNGNFDKLWHETEFAYQLGKDKSSGTEKDIAAMMFAVNAGYKFSGSNLSPTLSAGVDYLSGDNDPADDKLKSFNTLYATNHKFYGYMDFFPSGLSNAYGLMDIHAKVGLKLIDDLGAGLKFHMFNSTEDFSLSTGGTTKAYGNEVDLTFMYHYTEEVSATIGVSLFMPGDIFKQIAGDDTSLWMYSMLKANF